MRGSVDTAANTRPRYHGLDGLRASMMLLGLVLHATLSYSEVDYGDGWPFKDAAAHPVFDFIFAFIHAFRMPVFFVMAGFFAALVYQRRGGSGFLRDRTKRVFLPLVFGWPVLFPLFQTGFPFASTARDSSFAAGFAAVRAYVADGTLFEHVRTTHLWFLMYLMYLYLIALLLLPAVRSLPLRWRSATGNGFAGLLLGRFSVVWFAGLMAAVLVATGTSTYVDPHAFLPNLNALLFYGAFFGFGWLLYGAREHLKTLERAAWIQTLLGTLLFTLQYLGLRGLLYVLTGYAPLAHSLAVINDVFVVWLLLLGTTGLFLRYLQHPDPRWRYLADASYWLYLIHLPLTIWLPGWLSRLDWPAAMKFLTVLMATTALGLVSYEFLVRRTFLNPFLGSRRPAGPGG